MANTLLDSAEAQAGPGVHAVLTALLVSSCERQALLDSAYPSQTHMYNNATAGRQFDRAP